MDSRETLKRLTATLNPLLAKVFPTAPQQPFIERQACLDLNTGNTLLQQPPFSVNQQRSADAASVERWPHIEGLNPSGWHIKFNKPDAATITAGNKRRI